MPFADTVCISTSMLSPGSAIDFPVIRDTKLLNIRWQNVGVHEYFSQMGLWVLFVKGHDRETSSAESHLQSKIKEKLIVLSTHS